MTAAQRINLRWFLLAFSVCSATGALYLFSIIRAGEGSGSTVFQLSEETDYLWFDWTSDTSVRITGYSDGEGIMYKVRRAGNIDIQFLPLGTL